MQVPASSTDETDFDASRLDDERVDSAGMSGTWKPSLSRGWVEVRGGESRLSRESFERGETPFNWSASSVYVDISMKWVR